MVYERGELLRYPRAARNDAILREKMKTKEQMKRSNIMRKRKPE